MAWTRYTTWNLFGFAALALFMALFLFQLMASQGKRTRAVPVQLQILGICGSGMLLVYAIHRRDPVFIAVQIFGSVLYIHNLMRVSKTA